ncbi:MAG: hypothetical protein KJO01_08795 [Gammaproteobacteria bacterium]|nr:hypothetical protein [Gammaproteobacteria bacterium]MBT8109332.1 hypothetical protein [Gammaproteobacteria bacterium]NNL44034.1 hypothetical protein [Woeseiaceae bacterium]
MIFFGSKGKVVAGEVVQGVQCESCQNSQHASFGILNYFHLYWIPTFLTSRKAGIECMHCKRTLVGDELPSHLADQIKSGVFTTGNTLPMFSGLIIIGVLIMMGMYAVQQDDAREATYVAEPAVNDYYVVNLTEMFEEVDAEYPYGLMRITDVSSTGIEMQVGNMAYNKASAVKKDIRQGKASTDTYYGSETLLFELADLQQLRNSGAVYSIER